MKPLERSENFNLTTATETKTMGIDDKSTAHIITLLTDLYSDPELAVIREYSTNARDSHIAANQTRPIEITTPTSYGGATPMFQVKDFGLGLSKEDITEVYSMYGSSTKRDTNEATGMLGLGCKSGLTYAVSFTIDAVKDGWRTVASVAKGANGVGEIQILLHEEVDLANGVTVTVPVDNPHSFYRKVMDFFWYWRGGVLVNKEVPPSIDDGQWVQIDPDVYTISRTGSYYGTTKSKIVQGGVAYPMKEGNGDYNHIIAYVPIGTIDFVPSREDLMHTDRTDEIIKDAKDFVQAAVLRTFQSELEECANDWQRINLAKRMTKLMRTAEIKKKMPDLERFRSFGADWGWHVSTSRGKVGNRHRIDRLDESFITKNCQFVRNFGLKTFTNQHWDRLQAAGFEAGTFLVLPESYSKNVGTAEFPGIDWRKVPKIQREKRKSVAGARTPTQYICYTNNRQHLESDLSAFSEVVYYETHNRSNTANDWSFRKIGSQYPKLMIVLLTPKQVPKFKRLFPNIKDKDAWMKVRKNLTTAKLTPEILVTLNTHSTVRDFSKMMRPYLSEIKGPEFKALLTSQDVPSDLEAEVLYHGIDVEGLSSLAAKTKKGILKRYPLLLGQYRLATKPVEHIITYVNAIDAQHNRRVA